MSNNRNIIGLNRTMTKMSTDESKFNEDSISWEFARNAIGSSEKGERYILSNEPSNYLCAEVVIEAGSPTYIVGMIYLYDDKWAIFSTQNINPDDGGLCEVGIFDKSSCCYVPVVRSRCFKFSKSFPVRGVSKLGHRQNFVLYFGDGHNPDKVLDLGNYNLWYKCTEDRGDVTQDPWLNDIENIPYITYDSTIGDSCYVAAPVLPLDIDCNKLALTPKINIPCVNIKQSRLGGSLPVGIYMAAVAYSDGINVYGNWFISSMAHVYNENGNINSVEVSVDFNALTVKNNPFDYYKLAIISNVEGQVTAYIVGTYNITNNHVVISFIDKGAAEPISIDQIMTRKLLYEKSDLIQKAGAHLVRLGPYSKFDFNYQPLANLIEVNWFVAEYNEKYYYDLKNNSVSARVEADVIQYMRDEVYTFYIRWVYNDGNYSSFYHIPGPPCLTSYCNEDEDIEQKNNAVYKGGISSGTAPDGGTLISWGYPGCFLSSERYDSNDYKRWNFTQFRDSHLSIAQKLNITLPYGITDATKFDLCGERIRLVRMPDETLHSDLNLYNKTNQSIRNLGVRFRNIYHPVDERGNLIEDLVGFEIWRAVRGANRTIVAKGVIKEASSYNYKDEKSSNNAATNNAIFEPYPCETDVPGYENPFLGLSKILLQYQTGIQNVFTAFLDLDHRDTHDLFSSNRYTEGNTKRKDFIYFHSPETTFGYPYLNGSYYKVYGEVYNNESETIYFVNNTNLSKSILLSVNDYITLINRSTLGAFKVLNGSIQIRYGGHGTTGSPAFQAGLDVLGAGIPSGILLALKSIATLGGLQISNSLMPSFPVIAAGMNAAGFSMSDVFEMTQNAVDSVYAIGSILGGMDYKYPTVVKSNDGLLDSVPKGYRAQMMIPLYFFALNEVYYDNMRLHKSTKPFQDYMLTGATYLNLLDFERYQNQSCVISKIQDSVYLLPYIYNIYDYNNNKSIHVNHKYRVQCVLSQLDANTLLPAKLKHDRTIGIRIYKNCCCVNNVCDDRSSIEKVDTCRILKPASLRYVSYKVTNQSPYSQIYGQRKIKLGCYTGIQKSLSQQTATGIKLPKYESDYLYGGDTYVTRYTEIDRFMYFTEFPYKLPDGFEFNYLAHRNILFPRFWYNSQTQSLYESYLQLLNSAISTGSNVASLVYCEGIDEDCDKKANSFVATMAALGYDVSSCAGSIQTLCTILGTLQAIIDGINNAMSAVMNLANSGISALSGVTSSVCGSMPSCTNILSCLGALVVGIGCMVMFVYLLYIIIIAGLYMIIGMLVVIIAQVGLFIGFFGPIVLALQIMSACLVNSTKLNNKLMVQSIINYNLDGCTGIICKDNGSNLTRFLTPDGFNDLWAYLAHANVKDFFVESKYNSAFRITYNDDFKMKTFDPYDNNDLKTIFSIDNIKNSDFFIYNSNMEIDTFENVFSTIEDIQPIDYNETDAAKAYVHDKRLVIYSLPALNTMSKTDAWRIYLPLNFKYFHDIVTGFQDINGNGAIVFFRFKPPMFYPGVETLQMQTGRELIIGTGGLFAQAENSASNADPEYQYGSMQSVTAIANTPFGIYYISNNTHRIFQYSGSLVPISDNGLKLWMNWYGGFSIKEDVLGMDDVDNTLLGVGSLVTCDNKFGIIYFIKRDYRVTDRYRDNNGNLTYKFTYYDELVLNNVSYKRVVLIDDGTNKIPVPLVDFLDVSKGYVEDISWTLSYDPYIQSFVAYHDWHPDLAEGSNDTFVTVKGNGIWVHNQNCHSYCNFYGNPYNFELIIRDVNKSLQVSTNRSIEYYLEAYKYGKDCQSQFHKLDYNFDNLIVYNSEQCSGLLNIITKAKNNPFDSLNYPKYNIGSIDVLCEKVEQKYRINGYYDMVKDRGEYSGAEIPVFVYGYNGVDMNLNAVLGIDYTKPPTQRKRFRHYILYKYFIKKKDIMNNDIPYNMRLLLFVDKNNITVR